MQEFVLNASDGGSVACYKWLSASPRAVVHIAHGMGEHARRYDAVARALNQAGYHVYANDHRGHGHTGEACLGNMGADGWNRVLADAFEINRVLAEEHAELPRVLLGHSMGSMMSQQYVTRYGATIDALVLSGSPGFKAGFANVIARLLAAFECWRLGPDAASDVMQKALFGDANKAFAGSEASGFEWLSRDDGQVQKYIDDDQCGFVLSTGSLVNLFAGSRTTQNPQVLANIPQDLPIYVFSGTADPVHGGQADIQRMLQAFYHQQLRNIEVRWYEGGRHEMFNETNRDEVIADLVIWLDRTLAAVGNP